MAFRPDVIPLFPLGTVLYPGLLLPLHVFEPRYRRLVADLRELPPAQQLFGVVAIRRGREVGEAGVSGIDALHHVGCSAHVLRVDTLADGGSTVVTTGGTRFRVMELIDASTDVSGVPYLQARVTWLDEGNPAVAQSLVPSLLRAFADYLEILGAVKGVDLAPPEPPADPAVLSYLVAATVVADLADKQVLLEAEDTAVRMSAELSLLRRETALLRHVRSTPATELAALPVNPN